MSASPAKGSSGPTPTNSGHPPLAARKKAPVSIFNPKKKAPARKPLPANTYTASGQVPVNGARPAPPPPRPLANGANGAQSTAAKDDVPGTFHDYPIFVSKSALMQGLHYHGMRLQSKADDKGGLVVVDPFNDKEFTRPVRLYRRRPQDKPDTAQDVSAAASGDDDKDREMREAKRAERQAEREANQALIAPTGDTGKKPQQKKKPQKKVEDVYYNENNPQWKERSQLRYEEARPWHLEDFDNNNRWVGSYEKPLSHKHVMFEVSLSGFNMIPVEKWYRFIRTDKVKTLSDAQIEKMMEGKHAGPRWFGIAKMAADEAKQMAIAERRAKIEAARKAKAEDDDEPIKNEDEYRADVDEIDFEYNDEFADDDEGHVFGDEHDEEAKDTEVKLRKEQRNANLPDADIKGADEVDWVEEERKEQQKARAERKKEKKIKKQLKRKEERHEYESDDEMNRYWSSSDSEDSEIEREREEEERKKKEEAEKAASANGDRSGASSKGTNTPTGRPEKKSMKRDADLSDLSGNESSRRKKAKLNGVATAPNGARQLSRECSVSWSSVTFH